MADPERAGRAGKGGSGMVLIGALALAACGSPDEPGAAPGDVERFTVRMERDAADEKAVAVRDADARAKVRADKAVRRIAASERDRLGR